MRYSLAITARYGGLAVQFALVLLVANTLPPEAAGRYFVAFGLVTTLFCLVGLGLPDGLVIRLGQALAQGQSDVIKDALHQMRCRAVASAVVLFGIGAGAAIWAGQDPVYCALTAIWAGLYGMVFVAAQGLVALRAAAMGAFFFYSATNLALSASAVPYLLLSATPTLGGLMAVTIGAAALAACAGHLVLWQRARRFAGNRRIDLGPASRAGGLIALSRVLQSMLYWVPVWVTAAMLGSAEAAIIATAGRLLIGVSAAIAALRFSVRPAIVAAAAAHDWSGIEALGRRISLATTVFTLFAIVTLWLFGRPILDHLLGDAYVAAWPVLMILLLGALAEAFGGPVDEILKMTGNSRAVFYCLIVTIAFETVFSVGFAQHGVRAIAMAQVAGFTLLYGCQIVLLWRVRSVVVAPLFPRQRMHVLQP